MQSHMILFRSAGRDRFDDDFAVRTQAVHEPIAVKRAGDVLGEADKLGKSGLSTLKRRAEAAHLKESRTAKP